MDIKDDAQCQKRQDDDFLDGNNAIEEEKFIFLTLDQVTILHEEGIRCYSPTESFAIRDHGLLESAVMTPRQTFGGEYLYPTMTQMATAYLIGLARNHPFENGNKRVAFAACATFLRMNGYRLTLTQEEAVELTLGVINHHIEREDAVSLLSNVS